MVRNSTEKVRLMTKQNTNHDLLLAGAIKIKFLCSEYKYIVCSSFLSKKNYIFVGFLDLCRVKINN